MLILQFAIALGYRIHCHRGCRRCHCRLRSTLDPLSVRAFSSWLLSLLFWEVTSPYYEHAKQCFSFREHRELGEVRWLRDYNRGLAGRRESPKRLPSEREILVGLASPWPIIQRSLPPRPAAYCSPVSASIVIRATRPMARCGDGRRQHRPGRATTGQKRRDLWDGRSRRPHAPCGPCIHAWRSRELMRALRGGLPMVVIPGSGGGQPGNAAAAEAWGVAAPCREMPTQRLCGSRSRTS